MKNQALKINSWGKNVYVKIPVVNSKGYFMGKLIRELNKLNIKLNITAVYSSTFALKILKCITNNKSKIIISIFAEEQQIQVKILYQNLKKYFSDKNIVMSKFYGLV